MYWSTFAANELAFKRKLSSGENLKLFHFCFLFCISNCIPLFVFRMLPFSLFLREEDQFPDVFEDETYK